MESIDPATGKPLPPDAIQRVLFIAPSVHVYNIPPLTSTKGYMAASWTEDNNKRQIFTARLRIIETATSTTTTDEGEGEATEQLKTDLVLEDSHSGALFAAAPYVATGVVEPVLDSSRFFAVRVQDPSGGRRAVLGVGFEERGEAFDFGVALQEAARSLGLGREGGGGGGGGEKAAAGGKKKGPDGKAAGVPAQGKAVGAEEEDKRDYSLKEGETITINLGGSKFGRRSRPSGGGADEAAGGGASLSGFSLPPPPPPSGRSASGGGGVGFGGGGGGGGGGGASAAAATTASSASILPPPPPPSSASSKSRQQQRTKPTTTTSAGAEGGGSRSAAAMGFDDGEFGEFA